MEDINYKEQDRKALIGYFISRKGEEIETAKAFAQCGANKLRFWTLLYELEQEGTLSVTQRSELGTPEKVRMRE